MLREKREKYIYQGYEVVGNPDYQNGEYQETEHFIDELISKMPNFREFYLSDDAKKVTYAYFLVGILTTYDRDTLLHMAHGPRVIEQYREDIRKANSSYSLVQGHGVCSGFSIALCDILDRLGVESKYVLGLDHGKREVRPHIWNQVKVDGNWYNMDVTNDSDFLKEGMMPGYFLVSDKTMRDRNKEFYSSNHEYCDRDYDVDKLEDLMDASVEDIFSKYKDRIGYNPPNFKMKFYNFMANLTDEKGMEK